jgi:predicted phage terminase large subunit-like protein
MRFRANRVQEPWELPDWRTEDGELLAPKRYDEETVATLEMNLGSEQNRSAQFGQDPLSDVGNLFKVSEIRRDLPTAEQLRTGIMIQSWDARFKDDHSSGDFVAGQVWLAHGAERFCVARVNARLSFSETIAAIKKLSREWPNARVKLLENKANGPSIFNTLQSDVGGFKLINPTDSKVARANAVSPIVEGGNVHILPGPIGDEMVSQIKSFPKGQYDDEVDAMTQALIYFDDPKKTRYSRFVANNARKLKGLQHVG